MVKMSHENGHDYAAKHKDAKVNKTLAAILNKSVQDNNLTCAAAHRAAAKAGVPCEQIGVQTDLLGYQITLCQLGLFGYEGGKKGFDPDMEIPEALDKILDEKAVDGRISCQSCWQIAADLKMKRLSVGSACELKEFKIKFCQLGAF